MMVDSVEVNFIECSALKEFKEEFIQTMDEQELRDFIKVGNKLHAFIRFIGTAGTGKCYLHLVAHNGYQYVFTKTKKRNDRPLELRLFSSVLAIYNIAKNLNLKSITLDMDIGNVRKYQLVNGSLIIR
jgi:hypothetical protein